jgi:threonine dehydrogenase-like Zn-dependent dehydrogenase
MYAAGDVRVETRDDPKILEPTDAIIRLSATCVCGSDLWPYRGIEPFEGPAPMGHEYVGIVEEVGSAVRTIKPGQFVIGSFWASDNTCEICRAGYQSSCLHRVLMGTIGTQAELARVPLADGTLVATPDLPPAELIPSFLAASDVLGTGWFGAAAAEVGPGKTVAVVGDGAVGLLAVLAAKHLGAERIIAISRHTPRQELALEFGATDIVEERGDQGVARIKELTSGLGAHSVVEAVGTQESMMQAIRSTRPGAPLPAPIGRPHLEPRDRSRHGLRPGRAARGGRRGVPRHGRTPRHQGAALALKRGALDSIAGRSAHVWERPYRMVRARRSGVPPPCRADITEHFGCGACVDQGIDYRVGLGGGAISSRQRP